MKVFFQSFGCKVNQYETENIRESFIKDGFIVCNDLKDADVVVINSCTVTSSGDNRSIKALKQARKTAPDAVTVLTGCMPQASPDMAEKLPEADIITGTKNRSNIISLVKEFINNKKRRVDIEVFGKKDRFEDMICKGFSGRTRAFVKIQDGCDRFCSYCMIPYARGRCRSKPLERLKEEAEALAQNGYKEIVLVGINLAFYGIEFGACMTDAAELCSGINGIERVRLGSLEPEMISNKDLERLSRLPGFCPQFHLSLQSGCDKTLKAMNRKYTCAEYSELVERIRNYFPDCSVTTDIMVGFPNETDEDFEQTMDFAESIGFSKIHVFPYSSRPGTAAAKMKGHLPERVKTERMKKLISLGEKMSLKFHKSLIGKVFPVLFERENDPDFHVGHTPNYTLIKIPEKNFQKSLKREIFYVKIEEGEKDCCIGKIVNAV